MSTQQMSKLTFFAMIEAFLFFLTDHWRCEQPVDITLLE